jgi:PPM family protein phosphatase
MKTVVERLDPCVCGMSHVGRVRKRNEDRFTSGLLLPSFELQSNIDQWSFFVDEKTLKPRNFRPIHLAVVADGMGGHAGGDLAAEISIQTFVRSLLAHLTAKHSTQVSDESSNSWWMELQWDAIDSAQGALYDYQASHPETRGMGTTFTAVLAIAAKAYIAHLGDTRCYRIREESIEQLTLDHTVAQLYFDSGVLTKTQFLESSLQHRVYKSLGGSSLQVEPDFAVIDLEPGDKLLLCTDGLTKHLGEDEILREILENEDRTLCDHLVFRAVDEGGRDNVTVVSMEW